MQIEFLPPRDAAALSRLLLELLAQAEIARWSGAGAPEDTADPAPEGAQREVAP